jgi:hypothetical protein
MVEETATRKENEGKCEKVGVQKVKKCENKRMDQEECEKMKSRN